MKYHIHKLTGMSLSKVKIQKSTVIDQIMYRVQCFTSFFGSSLYNRRQICSNMGTATSVLTGLGETSGAKIHCQRCIWAALMSSKPNKQIIQELIQQITQSCSSSQRAMNL